MSSITVSASDIRSLWGNHMELGLADTLARFKISLIPDFDSPGMQREGSQWMRAYRIGSTEVVYFGDWKTNTNECWMSPEAGLSEADIKLRKKAIAQASKERHREIEAEQIRVRDSEVQTSWQRFVERGTTAYLERKQIPKLYGCKIDFNYHGPYLIVPAFAVDGVLWNFQSIYNAKLSAGDKFFWPGARVKGLFHALSPLSNEKTIYLAEGFATAASIHLALNESCSVVCCFNAGNLLPVALSLREKYPNAPFIFCADDDAWVTRPNGQKYNPGLEAAFAAVAKTGGKVLSPRFRDLRDQPTDFNDLHVREGLAEVTKQLSDAQEATPPEKAKPSERNMTRDLLESFHGTLLKQEKDLFIYDENHWKHKDPNEAADYFRQLIEVKAKNSLSYKELNATYGRFLIHVPHPPRGTNMFAPSPDVMNFRNGALQLLRDPDGKYSLILRPHDREDYLMHMHPFDYELGAGLNDEFERSTEEILAGEGMDLAQKAYFEVLGCTLFPAFPKIVFFVGPPKSGKSTLIFYAVNLVHTDLRCSVDPSLLSKFNVAGLAGKMLNFDTDVRLTSPISDDVLKKIEDRIPLRMERKNMSDIYALPPAMHLYGCNRMPVSGEGPDAYDRRALILPCTEYRAKDGEFVRDYAHIVWKKNPSGIIRRAVEGLNRVVAQGGHFTEPEASKREKTLWKESYQSTAASFLSALRQEDMKLAPKANLVVKHASGLYDVKRSRLWDVFKLWFENTAPKHKLPIQRDFYTQIRAAGIREKRSDGVDYFVNIALFDHQSCDPSQHI